MLRDSDFKIVYSTGDENEPNDFFIEALLESSNFNLGLGFFSSSGFRALSLGFAYFISNGGKMKIIINHFLSSKDKEAICGGYQSDILQKVEDEILNNFFKLKDILSKNDEHFFKCLSWLIATKRLEIMAVIPTSDFGIAHHKFGIFSDKASDKVVFAGSVNFSETALFYNVESLSCYRSWINESSEQERIKKYSDLFEKMWNGENKKLVSIPLERVKVFISDNFVTNDINDLIDEEIELLKRKEVNKNISPKILKKLDEANRKVLRKRAVLNKPQLPEIIEVRDYQEKALLNWKNNQYQGFFEMATGTGKTITSLICSVALMEELNRLFLLVLVPTISLAEQWKKEVAKFKYPNIQIISSLYPDWPVEFQKELNSFKLGNSKANVFISTYDSFKLKKFKDFVDKLPDETLLIADEAHIMGASELRRKMPHSIKYRLGLSATPHRHFDDSGTHDLMTFFNSEYRATFSFTMKEAIAAQFLCPYKLYPVFVELTESEYSEYIALSKEIAKRVNLKNDSVFEADKKLEKLLRDRRNILNKAENKLEAVSQIIDKLQLTNEVHHTLVYCPEGKDNQENNKIIDKFGRLLGLNKGLRIGKFVGETPAEKREQLLEDFDSGKIQCLLAMKCLDEGVDVKRTETAIFVASTTNPRQYIQRRGRVLRTHQKKSFAYLYDIIAIPPKNSFEKKAENVEKVILQQEFKRYKEFAQEALNYVEALDPVKNICEDYNIKL